MPTTGMGPCVTGGHELGLPATGEPGVCVYVSV